MEEKANGIINKLNNALSQINPGEFMNKIKSAKEKEEFIDISKKFCEVIINIKGEILIDISEQIHSLVSKKDKPILDNNESFDSINLSTINNKDIKNILTQFKFKLSNISSNISLLNSSLNTISGNIKKQKYSLATSRLEKLSKIKDNINLNLSSLEKLESSLCESLKIDIENNSSNQKKIKKIEYNYNANNSKSKIKIHKLPLAKTPSPIKKNQQMHFSNSSNKKSIKPKKNISINHSIRSPLKKEKSISSNAFRNKSSIQIPYKRKETSVSLNKSIDKSDKKTISEQKEIIKKLENEIKILKNNNEKNDIDLKDNKTFQLKLENNVLLFLNNKLRKISDLIFSITFSINNLQNKYSKIGVDEEYDNIKNNLISMTSEISETKSDLLKMSLENENIVRKEKEDIINDNNIFNLNIENELNLSLYKNKIKNLQKENDNLKASIEQLKSKIDSFNKLISLPDEKQNEKIFDNNSSDFSSLKEKYEKKLKELKEIYDADIESRNIIEKLLNKKYNEMKESYEQKISKLNKKLEEKETNEKNKNNLKKIKSLNFNDDLLSSSTNKDDILKINDEISKVRFDKEIKNDLSLENSISLSLIKENNEDNELKTKNKLELINQNKELREENIKKEIKIKKLENEYNELLNKTKDDTNIKLDNEDKSELKKLKEELIKHKLNENKMEQDIINYQNNYKQINDEMIALKLTNNKLMNELNYNMKTKDEILSLKEINSSFANEINSIKNTMNNAQRQGIEKRNSGNTKTYSIESENDFVNKLKSDYNLLQINKKNLELQNKELNDKISKKDKEIICLITNNNKEKKNLNEQYKSEIEKLKNEIKDKTNMNEQLSKEMSILQKKVENLESAYANGGNGAEIAMKNGINDKKEEISDKKFKNLEKKFTIMMFIEANNKLEYNENDNGVDDYEDEEEEDEETDEEFIIKMKKINKFNSNDKFEMKIYKKENRRMLSRYEDALDENNELKKKMIKIEEIVINKQNELYNNLKKGFKALLNFLTINNKSKDKIIYFLNLIQFSQQEIKIMIDSKK